MGTYAERDAAYRDSLRAAQIQTVAVVIVGLLLLGIFLKFLIKRR